MTEKTENFRLPHPKELGYLGSSTSSRLSGDDFAVIDTFAIDRKGERTHSFGLLPTEITAKDGKEETISWKQC